MKLLVILFSPMLLSFVLYFLSFVFVFDYCGCVKEVLEFIHFSGSVYFNRDISVCLTYGALLNIVVLFFPFTVCLYLVLNVERVIGSGVKIDVGKTFLASVLILAVYLSIFFVPVGAYSSRGGAAVGLIFGQPFLFYLFLVFPCQILSGLWALCIKTRLFYSN